MVITDAGKLLDGLGYSLNGNAPMKIEDAVSIFDDRIKSYAAAMILSLEIEKIELERERSTVRIGETNASRGLGIARPIK